MPAPQWPVPAYTDGSVLTTAAPAGIPVFQSPIPLTTAKYVFTQEWRGPVDQSAVALNTPHPSSGDTPDYSSYLLVSEGPRRDLGGGEVQWTRTYAQIPASYSLVERFPYSYIGTLTSLPTTPATNVTRPRVLWTFDSRVQHDYFCIGASFSQTDPITGTVYAGGSLTTFGNVDRIQEMVYVFQNTIGGALYGGITLATDILNPAGSTTPTWPTSDDYNNLCVGDALNNKWGASIASIKLFPTNTLSGGPPPATGHMAGTIDLTSTPHSTLGGQLPAEPSWIEVWMGNIWVRRTRYVLAR